VLDFVRSIPRRRVTIGSEERNTATPIRAVLRGSYLSLSPMWKNQRLQLCWTALSLVTVAAAAASFAPLRSVVVTSKKSESSTTRLKNQSNDSADSAATFSVQRRSVFGTVGIAAAWTTLLLAPLAQQPQPAAAEVDYSRIQDLLGPGGDYATTAAGGTAAASTKRPTYLTEPTDEFKASEAKATEFRRKNLKIVQQFNALLDAIGTVPNDDETKLATTLDELRRLVKANGGLPIGITKDDIVKTCRRRKAKKYWPTTVEVAYVF
jgi:hypothetical protein